MFISRSISRPQTTVIGKQKGIILLVISANSSLVFTGVRDDPHPSLSFPTQRSQGVHPANFLVIQSKRILHPLFLSRSIS
ncbi:hypothetical protein SOVF_164710, partial [Spinacia oleracea]